MDFHSTLEDYAQQGYRIIALAYKQLDKKITYAKVQRIAREKIECDLDFLGLVILENRLKDDTTTIINNLMTANIRTIMVTGDNMLTALSVARDCDMIPTGQSVITVNARPHPVLEDQFELYYNLNGTSGKQHITASVAQTPNGVGGDYALMTNSNSVASLETIDTFTHNTQSHDVEGGYCEKPLDFDHDDPLHLVPELASNNYRFAMTGKTWAVIRDEFPELLPKFVTRGTVFARMSPDQKQALVLELQDLGYYVAMCGDGANDCGALKAAHTGISLSEAESSVASPFTSRNPTIACVPLVIKEGRAALVTSVGIFKYMAAYSLVQFASVLVLYSIDSNLTDIQFLYIDLFIISLFAFFFGKTESYDGPLVKQTPLSSLVSLSPIMSLLLHLVFAICFQFIGYHHLQTMEWYKPFEFTSEDHLGCHENYTIFTISCFQYIILAFVFSKGKPYRKSIITNYGFLAAILINLGITIFLTMQPGEFFSETFQLIVPDDYSFRGFILMYGALNFLASVFVESVVIDKIFFKKLRYRFHNVDKSRRRFLAVENGLRQNPSWPPLSLYQNFAIAPPEKELSANTFAEICVESAIDTGLPFNKSSSVLNSFFENHDDPGLLESIDEVDSPPTPTASDSSVPAAAAVPHHHGGAGEHRNDSGIGLDVAPASSSTSSLDGGVRALINGGDTDSGLSVAAPKKTSTLVVNISANNEDEGVGVGLTNGAGSESEAVHSVQKNNHYS